MSVFARLGNAPASGTRVTLKNLKNSVSEKDLYELCASVGEVKDIEKSVSIGGKFSAIVVFARRTDANTCVSKFNGMTLDGATMEVFITGEEGLHGEEKPVSVFDRMKSGNSKRANVRNGLFGTAMDSDSDEDHDRVSDLRGKRPFSGSFQSATTGFANGDKTKLIQPFSTADPATSSNRNAKNSEQGFLFRNTNEDEGSGSRKIIHGRQGALNGGNKAKTTNATRNQKQPKPIDLDADLDNYFSSK